MPIEETTFSDPIYTRRDKFNHEYDITLNEISINSNKKGFSNYGYCYTLIKRIHELSHHERLLFMRHQLNASSDPMRWLLDLEKLIEVNSWESVEEFYNLYEKLLKETKGIISDSFKAIESGEFNAKISNGNDINNNVDIIFNTGEACGFLNISKSTIYKMTSSKSIPFYKPNGKNMYFKKTELEEYLSQKRQLSNSDIETEAVDYLTRNHKF